jgi:ribosomal protein S18 acetylase RimI-like enzyme
VAAVTNGELVEARGLGPDRLAQVERLAEACRADGRLKLEYPTLALRPPDQVNDVLWLDEDELVGFAGLYRFGFGPVEITGMVHPQARRRGIGRRLLEGALGLPRAKEAALVLLVADRRSAGGLAFAAAGGGQLHHSEHFMTLGDAVRPPVGDAELTMRPAGAEDTAFVDELMRAEFGVEGAGEPLPPAVPTAPDRWSRILEVGGERVGALRNDQGSDGGYIAGFVVAAQHRGRGFGRAGLRLAIQEQQAAGVSPISLEVETQNDRALGLYLDAGFETVSTMDYFALPRS